MLQAVLISQYRLIVAEENGIILKPVILYKSKTIAESNANNESFTKLINELSEEHLKIAFGSSDILLRLKDHLDKNGITFENFIKELKIAFDVSRIRNVNDTKQANELQIDINRLEDYDNEIRVIFAVDKLNEGWDVLNLFDIVRLYDTRDGTYSRGGEYKPGKSTMSEAQLIGRGARYWPFSYGQEPRDQRKFDKDLTNDLRLIEELYYHSPRDTDYLIEIRTALVKSGMMDQKDPETVTLKLKESFTSKQIYKSGHVYVNNLEENPHADKKTARDYLMATNYLEVKLATHLTTTDNVFSDDVISRVESGSKEYKFSDIPPHIVSKALDRRFKFYSFSSLSKYLPYIKTKDEFISNLNDLTIKLVGLKSEIEEPDNLLWLRVADDVFHQLQKIIETTDTPMVGSKTFKPEPLKNIFKKEKKIIVEKVDGAAGKKMSEESDALYLDLSTREWYAYEEDYGNSYEKKLVKLIDSKVELLSKKWNDLYLIRNERDLKLYSFDDGSAFMPDYLLYLSSNKSEQTYYVFIEPKGENLEAGEKWKEQFLLQIKDNASVEKLFEDTNEIQIIGLPFYQPDNTESCEPKNPEISEALVALEK